MKKIDVTINIEVPTLFYPEQITESDVYFVGWFVGSSFRVSHRCNSYGDAVEAAADYGLRHGCKCKVYRLKSQMEVIC